MLSLVFRVLHWYAEGIPGARFTAHINITPFGCNTTLVVLTPFSQYQHDIQL